MNITEAEILVKRKIRQYFPEKFQARDRQRLQNHDFVIISRNCWGGQVYQHLGLPYNTPFVGLYLFGPCYLKLLKDFDGYMAEDLTFVKSSRYYDDERPYPVGLLRDVEIHFEHYKDEEEARSKWNRRKARMFEQTDRSNYFFTICERREVGPGGMREFHQLPFENKLSFGYSRMPSLTNEEHLRLFPVNTEASPGSPNGKKLFKLTFLYMDLVTWFNSKKVVRTRFKD